MKLYLFNGTDEWDEVTARGIVANSREEAERLFRDSGGQKVYWDAPQPYKVEEYELGPGLVIKVSGYDATEIYVVEPERVEAV